MGWFNKVLCVFMKEVSTGFPCQQKRWYFELLHRSFSFETKQMAYFPRKRAKRPKTYVSSSVSAFSTKNPAVLYLSQTFWESVEKAWALRGITRRACPFVFAHPLFDEGTKVSQARIIGSPQPLFSCTTGLTTNYKQQHINTSLVNITISLDLFSGLEVTRTGVDRDERTQ